MDGITLPELEDTMTRNGDAGSYPYWATQRVIWNGREVLAQAPSRNFPATDTGD